MSSRHPRAHNRCNDVSSASLLWVLQTRTSPAPQVQTTPSLLPNLGGDTTKSKPELWYKNSSKLQYSFFAINRTVFLINVTTRISLWRWYALWFWILSKVLSVFLTRPPVSFQNTTLPRLDSVPVLRKNLLSWIQQPLPNYFFRGSCPATDLNVTT